MTITWHGLSCFSLKIKTGVKEEATMVIDPYDNSSGLRFPRTLTADLVAISRDHPLAANLEAIVGSPFIIREPGEYEVKGIFVYGIAASDKVLFRIMAEGLEIAHLGALDRLLTNEELAHFENVDVLFLPAGGYGVLEAKRASEIIGQIEPSLVVPMFYELPNLKLKLDPVEKFLKVMGAGKPEILPRLKVSRKDLPEEGVEIKILSRD